MESTDSISRVECGARSGAPQLISFPGNASEIRSVYWCIRVSDPGMMRGRNKWMLVKQRVVDPCNLLTAGLICVEMSEFDLQNGSWIVSSRLFTPTISL